MVEILIPISFCIAVTIILSLFFWYRYRGRNDMQKTLRAALDKGQELSPEIIEKLGHHVPSKDRDLRLALIWIALSIAFVVFGFALPETDRGNRTGEAQLVMVGIAAFPFCLGVAYLIMAKFTNRD